MPDVVQAVSIGPVPVFPGLAPRDAGQNKYDWRGALDRVHLKMAGRALLRHVRRGTVVIQSIRPLLQAAREEVKLSRMQIAGGWIHAQRIPVSGGWNQLGRANRSGIENQLRKKSRTI